MKCPACKQEMEFRLEKTDPDGAIYTVYHCYNHNGGCVWLAVEWREYTKEELDYE